MVIKEQSDINKTVTAGAGTEILKWKWEREQSHGVHMHLFVSKLEGQY